MILVNMTTGAAQPQAEGWPDPPGTTAPGDWQFKVVRQRVLPAASGPDLDEDSEREILLNRYGDWIRVRIEKHLGLVVAIGAAVLVLGFVIAIKLI